MSNCTGRTSSTSAVDVVYFFRVEKRATPSTTPAADLLVSSPGTIAQFGRAHATVTSINSIFSSSTTQLGMNHTIADTGLTAGLFAASISGVPIVQADSEL